MESTCSPTISCCRPRTTHERWYGEDGEYVIDSYSSAKASRGIRRSIASTSPADTMLPICAIPACKETCVFMRLRRGVDGMLRAGTTGTRLRGLGGTDRGVPGVRGRRVKGRKQSGERSAARGDMEEADDDVGRCDTEPREEMNCRAVGRRAVHLVMTLGDGSRLVLHSWPGAVAPLANGGGTDAYRSAGRTIGARAVCGLAVDAAGRPKEGSAVGCTRSTNTMSRMLLLRFFLTTMKKSPPA